MTERSEAARPGGPSRKPIGRARAALAGGLAALLVLAAPQMAGATSLKGKPFVVDPQWSGYIYGTTIFSHRGGFAALLAQNDEGNLADTIYFKSFTASGDARDDKTLVAEGKAGAASPAQIIPAGGLELDGGKALAAYIDVYRTSNGGKATGGLFAKDVSKKGKPGADEITLDTAKSDIIALGSVMALADGKGLTVWKVQDLAGDEKNLARLITPKGKLRPADIDLDRPDAFLWSVSPFGSGFLTLHHAYSPSGKLSIHGQVYDAKGAKAGASGLIVDNVPGSEVGVLNAVGLADGNILVLTTVYTGTQTNLVGQIYDKSWKKVGRRKRLMKGLKEAGYLATPLPRGDVLISSIFRDGDKEWIEFGRFDQKLGQVGKSAKTKTGSSLLMSQLLTLTNGDVVATYDHSESIPPAVFKHSAQIIKP